MKLHKARENAGVQVAFGFESIWLRKKRKFSEPIQSEVKKN